SEVGFGTGVYTYEFGTEIAVADPTKTHTLSAYATRQFEGTRYVANANHHFLPSGGDVTVTREVVLAQACNNCHGELSAHGGSRRDLTLCTTCHSPQTSDPDTGNTVDFPVMVHKIHYGAGLPSVNDGKPYQIIGHNQSVHDYSTVHYPQNVMRCESCHEGAQSDTWNSRPARTACASCHDDISFVSPPPEGKQLHSGGAHSNDALCGYCHPPVGGFAGIADAHLDFVHDPARPRLEVAILSVTNTAPGQTPVIDFSVQLDGQDHDIIASPISTLRVTFAGPTTDYQHYWQNTIQGSGASGTLAALGSNFRYTASTPIPVDAEGSYGVAIEGYLQPTSSDPRNALFNPIYFVSVTDPAPVARRQIVEQAKCNNCHYELGAHGGQRLNVDYCAMCHNANNPGDDRISRIEGQSAFADSVHLKVMIHKIHMGEDLTQPYVL